MNDSAEKQLKLKIKEAETKIEHIQFLLNNYKSLDEATWADAGDVVQVSSLLGAVLNFLIGDDQ